VLSHNQQAWCLLDCWGMLLLDKASSKRRAGPRSALWDRLCDLVSRAYWIRTHGAELIRMHSCAQTDSNPGVGSESNIRASTGRPVGWPALKGTLSVVVSCGATQLNCAGPCARGVGMCPREEVPEELRRRRRNLRALILVMRARE
jgi:hypothetical protein